MKRIEKLAEDTYPDDPDFEIEKSHIYAVRNAFIAGALSEQARAHKLVEALKGMLIFAQEDMLRMTGNAQTQKHAEMVIGNEYNAGFHGGNIQAFDYACKHLTNILQKIDKQALTDYEGEEGI